MFNKIYEIKYSDTDDLMRLKPSIFFEYLEDIAAKNADILNFGYDKIYSQNFGWFLLKYAIEIYTYPQKIQSLKVETESRGANKRFAYRDFYFFDENNNLIGKAASTWALIDLSNKAMLNPKETLGDNICEFQKREDDLAYNKIPTITNIANERNFDIRYDDIDVNKHVNNAKYIIWALEALPESIIKEKSIKRIDIAYKKEVGYGNSIISQAEIIEDKTVHNIKNATTQDDLCSMILEWN